MQTEVIKVFLKIVRFAKLIKIRIFEKRMC